MDHRREIRQFLVSRRARLSPEAAGIRSWGARRVPGLRREEVADLAGVSVDYYVRLERGDLSGASDSVLESLSRALKLNEAESLHLYDLARGGARRQNTEDDAELRPTLQRLLDAISAPAMVRNSRLDYVAANAMGRGLMCEMFEAETPNQARYVFLDSRSRQFHPDWASVANDLVAMLRLESGRRPDDAALADLVGELLDASREFGARWESADVRLSQGGTRKVFIHPTVGEVELTVEAMDVHSSNQLTFWAAIAEPGSPSQSALAALANSVRRPGGS